MFHQSQIDEVFVTCPFNNTHRVVAYRMHKHILKCRKNYKGPPLKMCTYNATHWISDNELVDHYKVCEDYHMFNNPQYLPMAEHQK